MTEKFALRKTISASSSHGRTPLNFTAPVEKIKPVIITMIVVVILIMTIMMMMLPMIMIIMMMSMIMMMTK